MVEDILKRSSFRSGVRRQLFSIGRYDPSFNFARARFSAVNDNRLKAPRSDKRSCMIGQAEASFLVRGVGSGLHGNDGNDSMSKTRRGPAEETMEKYGIAKV